jgi:hypothetical protein
VSARRKFAINLRLPPDSITVLKEVARIAGTSVSGVVNVVIGFGLVRHHLDKSSRKSRTAP